MSQKLNLEQLKVEVKERNHRFIAVSNINNLREGTITVICEDGHRFTTSVKSYRSCRINMFGKKNGCPECRKINAVQTLNSTPRTSRAITNRKPPTLPTMFQFINNRKTLITFLENNPNSYNNFMLYKIENESETLNQGITQNLAIESHHIIPKSVGGPDENWNLVNLTVEDHMSAHSLRYDVYQNLGDKLAVNLRTDTPITRESILARVALSHEASRRNQSGFWSSEQQAINGRRGGAKQTESKRAKYKEKLSPIIREKFQNTMVWSHPDFKQNLIIPTKKVELIIDLLPIFLDALTPDSTYYKNLENISNQSFTSSLSKVLLGKRNHYLQFRLLV